MGGEERLKGIEKLSIVGPHIIDNTAIPTCMGITDVIVNKPALGSYLINQFYSTFTNSQSVDITKKVGRLTIAFGKRTIGETISSVVREACLRDGLSLKEADKEAPTAQSLDLLLNILCLGAPAGGVYWHSERGDLLYFDLPQLLRKGKDPYEAFHRMWKHEVHHFLDDADPEERIRSKKANKIMLIVTGLGTVFSCIGFEIFVLSNLANINTIYEQVSLVSCGTVDAIIVGTIGGGLAYHVFREIVHRGERRAREATEDGRISQIDKTIINIVND